MAKAINIQRVYYPDIVDACESEAIKDDRSITKVAVRAIRKGLCLPDVNESSVDASTIQKSDPICQGKSHES
jgi:hypothetical protein